MQVALHTPDTIYSPRHVPSWILLAGSAGFVNGFAYLACGQFVTHVTGTVTEIGLSLTQARFGYAPLIAYAAFITGAAVAVVSAQLRAQSGGRDQWAAPLVAVAVILIGVAVAGNAGELIVFGSVDASQTPPVLLLTLLAFAAGLQNAAVASTTGMAVRTTHLTGPTTDVGMLIGAAILGKGAVRRGALRGAALRFGMILAFMAGAGLSVPASAGLVYLSLLVPAVLVLISVGLSFIPAWTAREFPFQEPDDKPAPSGVTAGLPSDARPIKGDED